MRFSLSPLFGVVLALLLLAVNAGETAECSTGACCNNKRIAAGGTLCRASRGPCDSEEFCNGFSNFCPADQFVDSDCCEGGDLVSAGTICRAANGPCDTAEVCNGVEAPCPPESSGPDVGECCENGDFRPAGTVCRSANGLCDTAETCSGFQPDCPAAVTQDCSASSCSEAMSRSSANDMKLIDGSPRDLMLTQNFIPYPRCDGTVWTGLDRWFRIVNGDEDARLNVTVKTDLEGEIALELYSGACDELSPTFCGTDDPNPKADDDFTRTLRANNEYLLRVLGMTPSLVSPGFYESEMDVSLTLGWAEEFVQRQPEPEMAYDNWIFWSILFIMTCGFIPPFVAMMARRKQEEELHDGPTEVSGGTRWQSKDSAGYKRVR